MADTDDIDPAAICARGVLTSADVAAIRRGYHKDGSISEAEADALFALEQNCRAPAEWGALFVEAIVEYLVHQAQPDGVRAGGGARGSLRRASGFALLRSSRPRLLREVRVRAQSRAARHRRTIWWRALAGR